MKLGLLRGQVEVVPHQGEWQAEFQTQRKELLRAAGHLLEDVQHVGSTAVPGLLAKPIIDIAASVRAHSDVRLLSPILSEQGWLDRGDKGPDGGYHLFVKEMAPDVRTHHLHVMTRDSRGWDEYVRFRDALIRDQKLRDEYATLKIQLQGRFHDSRSSYTASKIEFIERVLRSNV